MSIVICAESLIPEPNIGALDAMLDIYENSRTSLPWVASSLTTTAFALYRRCGSDQGTLLLDFFIGADAAIANNLNVLTRDLKPYRNYFARLSVIAP